MTAPLSADEQARLDRIEAAPEAEESIRERVARAIWLASNPAVSLVLTAEQIDSTWRHGQTAPLADEYRRIADAAIAVLRGGPSVAEEAVRRVEALCQRWEREAWGADVDYWPQCTKALRAALNGGER